MNPLLLGIIVMTVDSPALQGSLRPEKLRCEQADSPIGIGEVQPQLSWILRSEERGARQSAYQIRAASSPAKLTAGKPDLWDTGKVASDQTAHIPYGGKALGSRQRVWWRVRVWDGKGRPTRWSPIASFEIGLLKNDDWRARWISMKGAESGELTLDGAKWIWYPELDENKAAPAASRLFRLAFDVSESPRLSSALLIAACDNAHTAYVNGKEAAKGSSWQSVAPVDVTSLVQPGRNVLAIVGTNHGGPAGLAAALRLAFSDGSSRIVTTDDSWRCAQDSSDAWMTMPETPAGFLPPTVLGPIGMQPWGKPRLGLPSGPSPFFRREFQVSKGVARARIYASAHGLYELWLDGKRLGDAHFTPGWTDYRKRVQSQTFDVTSIVARRGRHAVGVVLGDGWYCGNVCWFGRNQYGPKPEALVQLEIEFVDGFRQVIASDRTWKVRTGPILSNDLLMGEEYDARLEHAGWAAAGFNDSDWESPSTRAIGSVPVVPQNTALVKRVKEFRPKQILRDKAGNYVVDFGQNMVGWTRLRVKGNAGTKVTLRFAEVLDKEGAIYTANLRSAKQTDTYTLSGEGVETWEPRFTFHGFRYVEVAGLPGELNQDSIAGIAVSSANEPIGAFECSNPMLNQLQHNIVWGMMGNYLEVPTDCPQRDERLGWMGDAQIFIRTACFNFNIAPFMDKWIQDIRDSQSAEGAYRDVTPGVLGENNTGAPAWGDAGVIVPWTVYRTTGDSRVLERHFDSMKRWVNYVAEANPDFLWTKRVGNNYGDWVSIESDTPKDVLATAFFANSAKLVAEAAKVLGKTEDARNMTALYENIRKAFNEAFVSEDGRIKGDTQTCYLLALAFDLLPKRHRAAATQYLVQDIVEKRSGHLSTGFVGTGFLAPVLTSVGRDDVAYKLLTNDTFPSWGYSIKNGATTIWERWDGWTDTRGFQDPGMNSFNHYAFGCIGEWMYARVAGIELDPKVPGYKRFVIRPVPGGGLTWCKASLDSVHGRIAVHWRAEAGKFMLDLTVPANTRAKVEIPTRELRTVLVDGVPAGRSNDVKSLGVRGGVASFEVGGGRYRFEAPIAFDP